MKKIAVAIAAALLLAPAGAFAKEWKVEQIDKKFKPGLLNIKAGDTVTFINAETKKRRHNIYTNTPGFEFVKVRKQLPGEHDSIVIDKAGKIAVRCALHPRMKMTINVQ